MYFSWVSSWFVIIWLFAIFRENNLDIYAQSQQKKEIKIFFQTIILSS